MSLACNRAVEVTKNAKTGCHNSGNSSRARRKHDFPIESSLSIEHRQGWRAAEPGAQTIRLLFDEPQEIRCISLVFEEDEVKRTQEFVLRSGGPFREIVRQQWSFSAPSSTREAEEYRVELSDVTILELTIVPDMGGGAACASLKSLLLA